MTKDSHRAVRRPVEGTQITAEVGGGAVTSILRGIRSRDGAPVLLRVPGDAMTPAARSRLAREQRLAHGLRVALPLDEVVEGPEGVVAVTYGRDLESLGPDTAVARRSLGEALDLARRLAAALHELHGAGIVHHAIHPGAFLIDDSGAVLITELGWAEARDFAPPPPRRTSLLPWTAPEETGRVGQGPDARSDLYALGVVLFQLLLGRLPFRAPSTAGLLHQHLAHPPPLRSIAPDLPVGVAAVVERLLLKDPADRYGSAAGVIVDLDACLGQWTSTGHVSAFPLGRGDDRRATGLRVPIGRDREIAALLDLLSTTRPAGGRLGLLVGAAGTGKSMIAGTVASRAARRARVAAGSCSPGPRALPYEALRSALDDLTRQWLTEPEGRLDARRERLRHAVGSMGDVLVGLIPAIRHVLGPQPAPTPATDAESRHRADIALLRLVLAAATAEEPLLLVLDDLHRSDRPTVELLHAILASPDARHLTVLGALRPTDGGADVLDVLGAMEPPPTRIPLGPLGATDVRRLVAALLDTSPADCADAAAALGARARGNPLFVVQLIRKGLSDETLRRAPAAERPQGSQKWVFTPTPLRGSNVDAALLALLTDRIEDLTADSRSVLCTAALLGGPLDPVLIAATTGRCIVAVREAIGDAREAGLVEASSEGADAFVHDRVREAAAALLDADATATVHRTAAWALYARGEPDADATLFAVAHHLARCASLLIDASERLHAASVLREAARRTLQARDPAPARRLLEAGLALVDDDTWSTSYELALDLHILAARAAYMDADRSTAEGWAARVEAHARTPLDRARVHGVRIQVHVNDARMADAVFEGLALLALLGVELPCPPPPDLVPRLFADVEAAIAGMELREMATLPSAEDPVALAVLDTIAEILPATSMGMPEMFVPVVLTGARQVLRSGLSPAGASILCCYGMVLQTMGRTEQAYELGQIAFGYAQTHPSASASATAALQYAVFLQHHREHLRHTLPIMDEWAERSLTAGSPTTWGYFVNQRFVSRAVLGTSLAELDAELAPTVDVLVRHGQVLAATTVSAVGQLVSCLRGRAPDPLILAGDRLDVAGRDAGNMQVPMLRAFADGCAAWLSAIHGEWAAVEQHAGAALATASISCHVLEARTEALLALSLLARPGADVAAATPLVDRLRIRAGHSPGTHGHLAALLTAELARAQGDLPSAADAMDRAVRLATEHGFNGDVGLVWERAAAMHGGRGHERMARACLAEARAAWDRWGATGRARALDWLVGTTPPGTRRTGEEQGLDADAVLRVAEAVAGELDLDQLLERVVRTLMTCAGADRACLLLRRGDRLDLVAMGTVSPDRIEVLDEPADEHGADLALSVVRFVQRTGATVELPDATAAPAYATDQRILSAGVRSVLCTALVRRGTTIGLVYLENGSIRGAFGQGRADLVRVIASLAASSVENARLVADLERTTAALRLSHEHLERHNRGLEDMVAARTRELRLLHQDRETVLVTMSEGIIRVDYAGRVTWVNPSAERLTGLAADAMIGHIAHDLLHPRGADASFPCALCDPETRDLVEGPITRPDGTRLLVEQAVRPVVGDRAGELVVTLRDVTERHRVAGQLRQAQKMEAVGRFAGGVAHEFNNLLTTIIGNLALLEEPSRTDAACHARVRKATVGAERAATLVRQMLAFGRRAELSRSVVDVVPLVDEVVEFMRRSIDRSIAVEWQAPATLPPILGDAGQIHQVLLNLCLNARDAVATRAAQGPPFKPTIRLGASEIPAPQGARGAGRWISVEVTDNGVGMDEETRARAFEPFFTTKELGQGTGLGLSVVYGIAEQHGGRVACDSERGRGTTCRLMLPATEQALAPVRVVPETPERGSGRVLLVDDEPLVREAGRAMLEHLGYEVEEAAGGREALALFEREPRRFDAVLLDLSMPEMTGEQTLEALRAVRSDVRVVLCSGYDLVAQGRSPLKMGARSFLPKPFDLRALSAVITDVLREA